MTEYKPHVTEAKKKEVEDIKRLFNEYPVVGIVNLENLPTFQLQRMKKQLKEKIILKHTKKRFIKIAIDQLQEKKNLAELKEKLKGVPALIFTKEDPFGLFKLLKKNQSNAVAKAGQEAPEDLLFPAGPTSFAPGPMIGELGQLGLKTEIVDGKIHVKEEKVLVEEGKTISAKVAELLAKLGIEPMKIGLNLTFTYENGEILGKEVLGVDEEEYINNIKLAHTEALNLAIFAGYATLETVELLVQKAARESKEIAKVGNLQTSETVEEQVVEAETAAKAVEAQMPEAPPAEEKKEETPPAKEEKKEEPVPEQPKEEPAKEEPAEEQKEEAPKEEKEEGSLEEVVEEEVEKEEPEAPKEETTPPEEKQEEPQPEEKPEPPQETPPLEEPKQEEAPKEEKKEEHAEETEQSEAEEILQKKTDEQVAQEVLQKITGEKIQQQEGNTHETSSSARAEESEQDMSKLINDLKDKKSKGEL